MSKQVVIKHKGEVVTCALTEYQTTLDAMVARLGAWEPGVSRVDFVDGETPAPAPMPVAPTTPERATEHGSKLTVSEACDRLSAIVKAEHRVSVELTAGELGKALSMNGALTFNGLKLREQAIRGLLARTGSTALKHVLGLRDRVADKGNTEEHRAQDKAQLLDILQRECKRFEDVTLKLRTRQGVKDVFAVLSPEYGEADAPEVLDKIRAELPADAMGTFSYDPTTTTWELRAHVWTPTPKAQREVGEPFEAFSSFRGKDNGTGRLVSGGGIKILVCLNGMCRLSESIDASRVHRSRIMVDLHRMAGEAVKAIHKLCEGFGKARTEKIDRPLVDGQLIPMEDVIPGFYRHMLTARKGELVGVLPGRTEKHVQALAMTYDSERRDKGAIVRADLANGFTKYIQQQPTPVRREAEAAIAAWVVSNERVQYAAA